jgi:hypothetical protein
LTLSRNILVSASGGKESNSRINSETGKIILTRAFVSENLSLVEISVSKTQTAAFSFL